MKVIHIQQKYWNKLQTIKFEVLPEILETYSFSKWAEPRMAAFNNGLVVWWSYDVIRNVCVFKSQLLNDAISILC